MVLLVVLGIGVALGMGWYILVGHNWNVAASNIDDSLGQMDGYTVFLVQGTRPLERASADAATEASSDQGAQPHAAAEGQGAPDGADGAQSADGASVEAESEPASGAPSSEAQLQDPDAARSAETPNGQDEPSLVDETMAESSPEDFDAALSKLVANYREKGAEVVIVRDWLNDAYELPRTMRIGSLDVSVFEVDYPARPAAVRTQAKLLQRRGSDFNVLVTNDPTAQESFFSDVGIVVSTVHDDGYEAGRYNGNSFCVDVPYVGQVETIIISPSGVISSKTLDLSLDE